MKFELKSIGSIYTPYKETAPYQPVEEAEKDFYIILDEEYTGGLSELSEFTHIFIIYILDKLEKTSEMKVVPPWGNGRSVGVFSSRSPLRPNPIGMSVVKLKKVVGNKIYISGADVFNKTPLLDIKPYIKDLDSKENSNNGWIEDASDFEHLALHIRGIPHDY
ncbi:MAG: tRNA (N6-threonylcarbamoyladenosine(37)-N6)-methyltransferase TrmO [Acidobacteriota bacterium]